MRYLRIFFVVCSMAVTLCSFAQRNAAYQQYIEKYKQTAIDQMRRHHIPASITLAQALLESGAGRSYLATRANNHFGIKVGMGWKGGYVTRDDDRKGEHFRKYKNAEESYEDHSLFLQQPRYKRLFSLDPQDYKGWARGLKACGYATLPTYAERLITIIETYDLSDYDEDRFGFRKKKRSSNSTPMPVVKKAKRPIKLVNGIQCVVTTSGDTWESLAKEMKVSKRKLLKYNETSADYPLPVGMNVFLAKKAKKADSMYKGQWHKIRSGESMYSISQFYGVRLENLYKMNFKDATYIPVSGDLLKVR